MVMMRRTAPALVLLLLMLLLLAGVQAFAGGQRDGTPLPASPNAPGQVVAPAMEQIQYSFREVAKRVLPVVVEINTVEEGSQSFFGFRLGPAPQPQQGLGSGVIIQKEGGRAYVLTNNHVVGTAKQISVSLYTGEKLEGQLLGADPRRDLAVVIFEARPDVPVATLGDSDALEVGDLVLAVGNPFGFESTLTMGIISAVGRHVEAGTGLANLTDYIQTDAAINPGNSGGALVNLRGEVIGINTWIASEVGTFAGLGFAVPINTARSSVRDILTKGKVEYGWLGVQIVTLDPRSFPDAQSYRDGFKLGEAAGAFVISVYRGSPADRAGVRPGDYITRIGEQAVKDTDHLTRIVGNLPPGATYDLRLIRAGRAEQLSIRLAVREDEQALAAQSGNLWPGMYVVSISPELRQALRLDGSVQGVAVQQVAGGSPAAAAKLQPEDVIQRMGSNEVGSVYDFYQALNQGAGGQIALSVLRKGSELQLSLSR
jgi:serine protease Do